MSWRPLPVVATSMLTGPRSGLPRHFVGAWVKEQQRRVGASSRRCHEMAEVYSVCRFGKKSHAKKVGHPRGRGLQGAKARWNLHSEQRAAGTLTMVDLSLNRGTAPVVNCYRVSRPGGIRFSVLFSSWTSNAVKSGSFCGSSSVVLTMLQKAARSSDSRFDTAGTHQTMVLDRSTVVGGNLAKDVSLQCLDRRAFRQTPTTIVNHAKLHNELLAIPTHNQNTAGSLVIGLSFATLNKP